MFTSNNEMRMAYKNAVRVCQLQVNINEITFANLVVDGYVGKEVLKSLDDIASVVHGGIIKTNIKPQHWEYGVKYLQEWYNEYACKVGYELLDIDNVYGASTHNVLQNLFEKYNQ